MIDKIEYQNMAVEIIKTAERNSTQVRDELIKCAKSHNLNPNEVERLVQYCNVGKNMQKFAQESDKTYVMDVIHPHEIVDAIQKEAESDYIDPRDYYITSTPADPFTLFPEDPYPQEKTAEEYDTLQNIDSKYLQHMGIVPRLNFVKIADTVNRVKLTDQKIRSASMDLDSAVSLVSDMLRAASSKVPIESVVQQLITSSDNETQMRSVLSAALEKIKEEQTPTPLKKQASAVDIAEECSKIHPSIQNVCTKFDAIIKTAAELCEYVDDLYTLSNNSDEACEFIQKEAKFKNIFKFLKKPGSSSGLMGPGLGNMARGAGTLLKGTGQVVAGLPTPVKVLGGATATIAASQAARESNRKKERDAQVNPYVL
jgi:hypothetical protein